MNKEIFKSSAVSTLNGMCNIYNTMIKQSIRTIWVNNDMNFVMSTPVYSQEEVAEQLEAILREYRRLMRELEDE